MHMRLFIKPVTLYIKHVTNFCEQCTVKDAWTMILLGVLLVVSGLLDLFHKIT